MFLNQKTEFEELKKEKNKYNKGEILYVRKSDDVDDDIEFVKIIKGLLPKKYKGTYTKCLKPLFGDSLSHAEVIIWDKELNEKLFGSGEMKKINSTSSTMSGSPKRTRRPGSFGSPKSFESPKPTRRSGSFGSPMRFESPGRYGSPEF